jgi:nucleoside-diphosphate-sugar epimerase
MRIVVTGASGFVGGAVCRAAVAAGHEVLAFGRRADLSPSHVAAAPYVSWDITTGPLADPPAVDAVVHCAGSVTDWGPRDLMLRVNQDGTRNVLSTFPGARFVHVSTASVYDPLVPTVSAPESAADVGPHPRHRDAYGWSKALAEHAVRTARPDAVILRPHAVYGPGDTTLLPRILDGIRGHRLLAVGTGRQLVSLTSVGNLTTACLLAAGAEGVSGTFNVTDASPLTLDEALRAFLVARGVAAVPRYIPRRVALPLAALAEAAAQVTGRPPRLTRYAVRHLAVERTLDLTAARERLGYEPSATSFAGADAW